MAATSVPVVGIDFGSHITSIALWYEDKDTIEVIADDLGSRTIPSAVAFRGDEIITGQSAISQMHKNASNSFDDVRSMLLNPEISTVYIPLLEKDITVQELGSHFFRNIHNQIKQQVGVAVRECVVSVPTVLEENVRKRLVESAQAGGMRIKACLNDSICALMAYKLDDSNKEPSKTLVIDIGWSKCSIALFDISGGMFFPVANLDTREVCGEIFVNLMAIHCAKDFTRKHKIPCEENKRSMMRLRRECENAMKSLSTGAEATIDIDSLCEGVDFSLKLSKARFEDLLSIPFVHLKTSINTLLSNAGWNANAVQQVCVSGGGSAIPKCLSILKSVLPSAKFPVGRFESVETQCVGAACHGKYLIQQGLIDNVPTLSPTVSCLLRPILLATSTKNNDPVEVIAVGTVIPTKVSLHATLPEGQTSGYIKLLLGPSNPADPITAVGEVVFNIDSNFKDSPVTIYVSISAVGEIDVEIKQDATQLIVGNLVIPISL